jgi:cell wall-associated NlpC family hydrolase
MAMQKKSFILTLIYMVVLAASTPVFAERRAHQPWFSHSPTATQSDTPVVETTPTAKIDTGHKVARQALSYSGTRYRYGGTTKRGMDCSGLVARVWSDLKMKKIPRASSALYNSGKPVHLAELRPGDLVFFKNTYKRGISHVGVYAGNNKFVHASGHSKGVTITKLSDPYYQLHYAGARRLY